MSSHGMQAALEADRRRTPPTELTDSLATIQDTKAGPLTFEARDALRRCIQVFEVDPMTGKELARS